MNNPLRFTEGQPFVYEVSDFFFSVLAYEGGWPVLSFAVSSSHPLCGVSILTIGGLAGWGRNLNQTFMPLRRFEP